MSLAGQSLWSSSDSGQDLLHHLLLLLSGGSLWTPLWQPCVCILLANLSGRDTPPIHTPAAEAVKLFTSICTGQTGRAFSHWPPPKQASLSHGMFLSNGAHVEWYSSTYTTGRCTHWAGQSRKWSVRLTGKKPIKKKSQTWYLVELERMFSSSGTFVLMKAGSSKCGEVQPGNTVDRNTWLAPPPGQDNLYCKYTLSISNHPTHMLSSCKQQCEPTATEQQSHLTTFLRQHESSLPRSSRLSAEHRLIYRLKKSNVMHMAACLPLSSPSLLPPVDILIAGFNGVLCGGWKGSVAW